MTSEHKFKKGDKVTCSEFEGPPGFIKDMVKLVGKVGEVIAIGEYSRVCYVKHIVRSSNNGKEYAQMYSWPYDAVELVKIKDIEED